MSRDKGTTGQAQNLATGRDGILTACPVPSRDVPRDRNERKSVKKMEFFSDFSSSSCFGTFFFCFRTSFSCFRTSFPVLERPFPVSEHHFPVLERPFSVLERLFPGFWGVILSPDVPGQKSLSRDICSCPCPGTKGHRDKKFSLSRDKGTTGRPVPVCPGLSRGTSRPLETLVIIDLLVVTSILKRED